MLAFRHLPAALIVLAGLIAAPTTVRAAQDYDNCTGFIDSLPATIATQGTWCLRGHLSTAITEGSAITIDASNVTLDCNDFKVGGLAAGVLSEANGIFAGNHQNATVRQCGIRGFKWGILLREGGGHLVEDNRLDGNLYKAIEVLGDNSRVQRNRIYDTGGAVGEAEAYGIRASADVLDNTIGDVFTTSAVDRTDYAVGIEIFGNGSEARGNRIRGLVPSAGGEAIGIETTSSNITVADNRISAVEPTAGQGVLGFGDNIICVGNTVFNFADALASCEVIADHLDLPAP